MSFIMFSGKTTGLQWEAHEHAGTVNRTIPSCSWWNVCYFIYFILFLPLEQRVCACVNMHHPITSGTTTCPCLCECVTPCVWLHSRNNVVCWDSTHTRRHTTAELCLTVRFNMSGFLQSHFLCLLYLSPTNALKVSDQVEETSCSPDSTHTRPFKRCEKWKVCFWSLWSVIPSLLESFPALWVALHLFIFNNRACK